MKKKILLVNKDIEAATKLKKVIECSCTEVTLVTSMEEALYYRLLL